jgi:DNA polymerase-1
MNNNWLILDCPFLCHRAFWAVGESGLSSGGQPTSVIYAFLRELVALQEMFDAPRVIFCWDVGESNRKKVYPEYKAGRRKPPKNATPEEITEAERARTEFNAQVKRLRREIIPQLGYANNFAEKGIEADDWIAAAVDTMTGTSRFRIHHNTIISSDHDLFQCLCPSTQLYSPNGNKLWTYLKFRKEYGVNESHWAFVKAIAGCSSDNIKGVAGVGEKTAIRYIREELPETHKSYKAIKEDSENIGKRLIELTRLPCRGLFQQPIKISKSLPEKDRWNEVMNNLEMKSLIGKGPYLGRR